MLDPLVTTGWQPFNFLFSFIGIEACLKRGEILPCSTYECKGEEIFPEAGGPQRSRLSRANGERGLFATLRVFIYGECKTPPRDALKQLLLDGDASIVDDLTPSPSSASQRPRPPNSLIILCDQAESNFEKDASLLAAHRPFIGANWVLDCISMMQILPTKPYVVLP